jgi:hypothetical protein
MNDAEALAAHEADLKREQDFYWLLGGVQLERSRVRSHLNTAETMGLSGAVDQLRTAIKHIDYAIQIIESERK